MYCVLVLESQLYVLHTFTKHWWAWLLIHSPRNLAYEKIVHNLLLTIFNIIFDDGNMFTIVWNLGKAYYLIPKVNAIRTFEYEQLCLCQIYLHVSFYITGNIVNILVLTRRRMKATMDCRMERAAYIGLIALAVSDSLFCLSTFPNALLGTRQTLFYTKGFK